MTTILVESGQISSGFSLGGSGSLLEVEQGGTAVNALLFSNVSALIEGFGSDIYLVGGVGRIENGGMLVSATFSTSFNGTTNYLFVSSGGTAIATTIEAGSAEVFSGGVITTIFGGGSEIGTTVTGGADTVSSGGHSAASIGLGNTTTVSAALSGPYSGAENTVVLFSTNTNGTFATAADRFAYNQTTGGLYYDAQGNKAGSTKELVAQFTNDPHLTAANLYFIV